MYRAPLYNTHATIFQIGTLCKGLIARAPGMFPDENDLIGLRVDFLGELVA